MNHNITGSVSLVRYRMACVRFFGWTGVCEKVLVTRFGALVTVESSGCSCFDSSSWDF